MQLQGVDYLRDALGDRPRACFFDSAVVHVLLLGPIDVYAPLASHVLNASSLWGFCASTSALTCFCELRVATLNGVKMEDNT